MKRFTAVLIMALSFYGNSWATETKHQDKSDVVRFAALEKDSKLADDQGNHCHGAYTKVTNCYLISLSLTHTLALNEQDL